MGVNTDYLGHVTITPSLNRAEYDYLQAFAATRHCRRGGDPYAVESPVYSTGRRRRSAASDNELAAGQPSFWCHWVPCPHGCCLSWNGFEKFYAGGPWLQYLIDHFLRPSALAERSKDPRFARFSFDHDVSGFIVGEQRDIRELFALVVHDGHVERMVLSEGDPGRGEEGHLRVEDRPWLARDEWDSSYPLFDEPVFDPPQPVRKPVVASKRRPASEKRAGIRLVPE